MGNTGNIAMKCSKRISTAKLPSSIVLLSSPNNSIIILIME
jgi:hypothetical protein